MAELGLEGALSLAMEAERKAQTFYAEAALLVQDSGGRDLLGRLAAFEQYHYQKLADLARSLRAGGAFIAYEGRTVRQFAPAVGGGEAGSSVLDQYQDLPSILSQAIENEKRAGARYQALAGLTSDSQGQAMFRTLAEEEAVHQRILEDEFFSLSNRGVWSGMYGE